MIKVNEKLTILHDDNSSFVDLSKSLSGFTRDTASVSYVALEDAIYIGFYKPINVFYVNMATANTESADITVKYYNGTSFVAITDLHDDSNAFARSGFVKWDRKADNSDNLEVKTTVNSVEQYWYKVELSADSSAMVINGLNIIFSDDEDLKREVFEISRFLPSGEASHILTHVAARDEIIQDLNLKGRQKANATTGWLEDITAFDLLDVSEVKLASTYLALSKIFFSASDTLDDIYMQKSDKYRSMYNNIINSMDLSVDIDDDGKKDKVEREKFGYGFITRL